MKYSLLHVEGGGNIPRTDYYLMTDKWLEDVSLFGSASEVREGIEKWYETGLETPILVPSSTDGGQFKAFEELFDLFT